MLRVDARGRSLDGCAIRKMCSDKRTFPTKQHAKRSLRRINSTRRENGEPPLHIYRCPVCGAFHLTRCAKGQSGGDSAGSPPARARDG